MQYCAVEFLGVSDTYESISLSEKDYEKYSYRFSRYSNSSAVHMYNPWVIVGQDPPVDVLSRKLLPSISLSSGNVSSWINKRRKVLVRWLPKLSQLLYAACNIGLRKQQGRERFPFTLPHARQDLEHDARSCNQFSEN